MAVCMANRVAEETENSMSLRGLLALAEAYPDTSCGFRIYHMLNVHNNNPL